mgnify:CR=1 FL=1
MTPGWWIIPGALIGQASFPGTDEAADQIKDFRWTCRALSLDRISLVLGHEGTVVMAALGLTWVESEA